MAELRRCRKCACYRRRDRFAVDRRRKDGLHQWCKSCMREYNRARYYADSTRSLARLRESRYGLTAEAHTRLLEAQESVCAICRRAPVSKRSATLHVDHDHRTGRIRGLLCSMCNTALGMAHEDPERLRAMADYLERHADS